MSNVDWNHNKQGKLKCFFCLVNSDNLKLWLEVSLFARCLFASRKKRNWAALRGHFDVIVLAAHQVTSSLAVLTSPETDVAAATFGIFYLLSMLVAGRDGSSQSQWRAVTHTHARDRCRRDSSTSGDVNWNEPYCRRDYADAATDRRRGRISIHETGTVGR